MNAQPRILVVDDEPNLRLMFRSALESAGHAVAEAADGRQALRMIEASPADLVLLDLQMPEMDGMATLRRLREAGQNVPVVIVTAHGSIPDVVAAMRLGAIDFLGKPVTPPALRRAVAEVLERHRPAPGPGAAAHDDPATPDDRQYIISLAAAKRALNRREFDAAEDLLKIASGRRPGDRDVLSLQATLRTLRDRESGPYHVLRDWV